MNAIENISAIETFRALTQVLDKTVGSLMRFTKVALNTYSSFEQIESGLQGVLKSEQAGTEMFERLRSFSFDTTFGVDTLSAAATQLLNVGTAAGDVETHLLRIGNIAQGDTNKFNELVSIYAKIQSTGKAGSMQLQQLALRGVPIYQYLQKIGVQGKATGEDVAKAFEEMTKEGEIFYGTMDRINKTIQGKEGFISDTWREFMASFAEASGFADIYKTILDEIYNVLQGVVDWLQEINSNPVYQAIFRGVLVGSITALTVVLGVGLVGALKAVIAKMTAVLALKTAINPSSLVFGITAGLGVGLLAGLKSARGEADALVDDIKEVKSELDSYDSSDKIVKRFVSTLNGVQDSIDYYQEKINSLNEELAKFKTEDEQGIYDWSSEIEKTTNKIKEQEAELDKVQSKYDRIKKSLDYYVNDKQSKTRSFTGGMMTQDEYAKMFDEASKAWQQTLDQQIKEKRNQLNEYERALKEGQYTTGKTKKIDDSYTAPNGQFIKREKEIAEVLDLDDETREKFEHYKKTIQGELEKLKDDKTLASIANMTWAQLLVKSFNLSVEDIRNGALSNVYENGNKTRTGSGSAVDTYISRMKDIRTRMKEASEKFGLELFKDADVDNINEMYETLKKTVEMAILLKSTDPAKFYEYGLDEQGLQEMIQVLNEVKKLRDETGGKKITSDLEKQFNLYKKNVTQRRIQEYIENGLTDEYAKQAVILEDQIKLQEALSDSLSSYWEEKKKQAGTSIKDNGRNSSNYHEYMEATLASSALSAISGSEVGTFIEEFVTTGDALTSALAVLVESVISVVGGMDGVSTILNPINDILKEFEPVIKSALYYILLVEKVLVKLSDALMKVLDTLTGGFFTEMAKSWDELIDAQDKETERLKTLNSQYKSLTDTMEEQEQYYIKERQRLNAETMYDKLSNRSVNDMILTPQGVFNTHPEDTIIAMKHPETLTGGGAVKMSVVINNTVSDSVNASVSTGSNNGVQQMIITISRKVANDMATGSNGWDDAFAVRERRIMGRALT